MMEMTIEGGLGQTRAAMAMMMIITMNRIINDLNQATRRQSVSMISRDEAISKI